MLAGGTGNRGRPSSAHRGQTYVPDLATAYLRPLHLLPATAADFDGPASADLAEAAAACPVGVPLPAVAAIVRRLAQA